MRTSYCTRLNEYEADIIKQVAAEVWPEHADNLSELIRAIIVDWGRTRAETGGKSATILKEIKAIRALLEGKHG